MKNNIVKILATLIVGLIISFIGIFDEHQRNFKIKTELVSFIDVRLVDCKVLENFKIKYSGMGYYTKVKTNCADEWYPILFDQMAQIEDNLFQKNPVIHKEANSEIIFVQTDTSKAILTIRAPQDMEDYSFLYFIWFLVAGFIIVIFIKY